VIRFSENSLHTDSRKEESKLVFRLKYKDIKGKRNVRESEARIKLSLYLERRTGSYYCEIESARITLGLLVQTSQQPSHIA